MSKSVRIISAALEEHEGRKTLRGVIEISSGGADGLQVADYQREQMPFSSLKSIYDAFEEGEPLPDIELGMRGDRSIFRESAFYLQDAVFIIDGLQRVSAGKLFAANHPGRIVRLGVKVTFNTTYVWEREQFIVLNTKRVRVSADKILFNMRDTSTAVGILFKLSENDKAFVLYDKISWKQKKGSKFLGGFAVAKVLCSLHVHKVNGISSKHEAVVRHLDRIMEFVGENIFRDNIRTFFEVIDKCWGLRNIQHYDKAPQIKHGFLLVFSRFLSDHQEFWRSEDKRLFVDAKLIHALRKFNIFEPEHANLCSSSGRSLDLLYGYLVDEVNKGKRGKRLVPRQGRYISVTEKAAGNETEETEDGEEDPDEISAAAE